MRKRPKRSIWRKWFNKVRYWFLDLRDAKKNADACYSARYLLEELNNDQGIRRIAEQTGYPEGVVVAALKNIYGKDFKMER
jgi:hypothetical protein